MTISVEILPGVGLCMHDMEPSAGELYKHESTPRGLVLIANYQMFDDDIKFPYRDGSDTDVKNFESLFRQIGYEVLKPHVNMTEEDIRILIDRYACGRRLLMIHCVQMFVVADEWDDSGKNRKNIEILQKFIIIELQKCFFPALKGVLRLTLRVCKTPTVFMSAVQGKVRPSTRIESKQKTLSHIVQKIVLNDLCNYLVRGGGAFRGYVCDTLLIAKTFNVVEKEAKTLNLKKMVLYILLWPANREFSVDLKKEKKCCRWQYLIAQREFLCLSELFFEVFHGLKPSFVGSFKIKDVEGENQGKKQENICRGYDFNGLSENFYVEGEN
ncbi:unnamed protein product, partial [Meganyctiphanes norvegica]